MTGTAWLTILTIVPLVGGSLLVCLPEHHARLARQLAMVFSLVALTLCLTIWHGFDARSGSLQFQEHHAWIPAIGAEYNLGIDGLGLLMIMLSAIVVPMAIAASSQIVERVPLYFSLMLFLQAGLFGTFTALNFIHWFVFWELSLIPAFFLVRLWGGPGRARAAMQFFVYTMVGSVTLLLAFLALYLSVGTFDFVQLAALARVGQLFPAGALAFHHLSAHQIALLVFAGAFLGFAVKVPLIPFHTWLPSTYAEAPAGTTMLLTGVMSKMGVYGFLRLLLPIFPGEMRAALTPLLWLALATIVLSAYSAFAQQDLKRIFAYSSINHLGYCVLAVLAVASISNLDAATASHAASSLDGAMLQMFNHGLSAATIFWIIALIEKRSGDLRAINDFGGIRKVAPVLCGLMGIALFSSMGLPGLNGFVGEFLIFRGVFPLMSWAAAISLLGLLLTAIFILTVLQRVFSGPLNERWAAMPDLTRSEQLALSVPIALMFVLGLYPQLILGVINSTAMQILQGGIGR